MASREVWCRFELYFQVQIGRLAFRRPLSVHTGRISSHNNMANIVRSNHLDGLLLLLLLLRKQPHPPPPPPPPPLIANNPNKAFLLHHPLHHHHLLRGRRTSQATQGSGGHCRRSTRRRAPAGHRPAPLQRAAAARTAISWACQRRAKAQHRARTTPPHTRSHACMHARTHAHTHTRTHACMHAHAKHYTRKNA